jgi:uncharacterized protein (TIGR00266 family)
MKMEYQIKGEPLPVVICTLAPGESVVCESGAMSWMSPNMQMETVGGGVGKMFGRMFSGESLFQNRYTAEGGQGMIAFASHFPGSIRAVEVRPDKPIVVQKSAFLACDPGVELSVFFQKKLGTGLFGGEGFIMQKLSGSGIAFIEIDGHAMEYELKPGQQIIVDTGYLAMMDSTCQMDVQTVKGVKNVLFGGESLFNTVVTGPGRVILQTMPVSVFAGMLGSLVGGKNN